MRYRNEQTAHSTAPKVRFGVSGKATLQTKDNFSYKGANFLLNTQKEAPSKRLTPAQQVENSSSEIKQEFSQLAMYFSSEMRDYLFEQIDELLNEQEFLNGGTLIGKRSFRGLLHFLIKNKNLKHPSLTLGATGNLVANWISGKERMSIEFMPFFMYRMVYSRPSKDKRETLGYHGFLAELINYLELTKIDIWKQDGSNRHQEP